MVEENVKKILSELSSGNNLGEPVTLVAATKTMSVETIMRAVNAGVTVIAENRVQEFREKSPMLANVRQDFIGHLQTNKVKYLVGKVSLIHSVDSSALAKEISLRAQKLGVTQDILVEINIGGELSKSGFAPDSAETAIKEISALPALKVCGLMAMLPKSDDDEIREKLCLQMREIYDKIRKERNDSAFRYLSMGMSADYKTAVRCGSNMVRLGTALFGQRT